MFGILMATKSANTCIANVRLSVSVEKALLKLYLSTIRLLSHFFTTKPNKKEKKNRHFSFYECRISRHSSVCFASSKWRDKLLIKK